jgi:hypothetical protein
MGHLNCALFISGETLKPQFGPKNAKLELIFIVKKRKTVMAFFLKTLTLTKGTPM